MKTGIIGLGDRIASLIGPLKAAAPQAEITAVADPSQDRLAVVTAHGDRPALYATAQDMLQAQRFDLVMIGSPNAMHLGHAQAALESDTPYIFLEKPVVTTAQDTFALARLIAQHDGAKRILVGLVLRYAPLYRALMQAKRQGQLGQIMSMEACEHIAPYHGSFFMRDWRRNTAMAGPFMLEKCCHDLDLYQSIAGARARKVASFGGRRKFLPAQRPAQDPAYLREKLPRWAGITDAFSGAGDIIDNQTALVSFENGVSLAFHTNLNVPDQSRRFAIIGTDGMAEGDFVRNHFKVTAADTGATLSQNTAIGSGSEDGHYGADEAMMADIIAHMQDPTFALPLSVIDALEAGLTALAIDQARQSDAMVDLAPDWHQLDAALAGDDPTK